VPSQILSLLFRGAKSERASCVFVGGCSGSRHFSRIASAQKSTGSVSGVGTNLGWRGPEKYVSIVPQIFDLWQDPQERYDLLMNNFTERTWVMVIFGKELKAIGKTYVDYPPRPQQSEGYTGPITLSMYERFAHIREALAKEGVNIPMPTGN
jgi:hypothetical protein